MKVITSSVWSLCVLWWLTWAARALLVEVDCHLEQVWCWCKSSNSGTLPPSGVQVWNYAWPLSAHCCRLCSCVPDLDLDHRWMTSKETRDDAVFRELLVPMPRGEGARWASGSSSSPDFPLAYFGLGNPPLHPPNAPEVSALHTS